MGGYTGGLGSGAPWRDQDCSYLRSLECERNALVAGTVQYYVLDRSSNVDPLYQEPVPWGYKGPFAIKAPLEFVAFDDSDEQVDDERGWERERNARMYIAADEWEREVDRTVGPKSSDVVVTDEGRAWDVVKAEKNGAIAGTQQYVGWKLELRRRSQFVPERKLP